MRRPILFVGLAAASTLAACQSEEARKAEYRAEKNQECVATLSAEKGAAALDVERFCGCVLDRQMAGRSVDDLEKLEPTAQQKQEWGVQCADASLRPATANQAAPAAPAPVKGGKAAADEAPKE